MRWKACGKRRKKRICKWIAAFLTINLLVNQSCLPVLAEKYEHFEYTEDVMDTVTDENATDIVMVEDADNSDVSGDIDVDEETDTDMDTSAESGIEPNTESAIDGDSDSNTSSKHYGTEALLAEAGDTFYDGTVKYRIISETENNRQVWIEQVTDVSGTFEIPSTVSNGMNEYMVVGIGTDNYPTLYTNFVFQGCNSLTSITIPDSVTSIGRSAFEGCSSLTSITIPDNVTDIGISAFEGCSSLTSIAIPDNVTNIGSSAFEGCSSLTNITIPDSVANIGGGAFEHCSSLTSIVIPDGVTSIRNSTFRNCSSLTKVIIPNTVTSIGFVAFGECDSLENITIPNSVTSIESCAFEFCYGLKSIIIPKSVTNIGACAFYCSNLECVTILSDNINIDNYAFHCGTLNSLRIALSKDITGTPDIVVQYGINSFSGCPDDRSLTFLTEDGTTVLNSSTTPSLTKAVEVYNAVDDGGIDDGYWYGWKLPDVPDISDVTAYSVTTTVNKDDSEWKDCEKTFALSADHSSFITDLTAVSNGTYTIYDTTGASDSTGYVNTNVTVEVNNAAAQAEVNYYTVTYYDEDTVISEQIVLKNGNASAPSTTPIKDKHTFYQWVTTKNGITGFDFSSPIIAKTGIYTSWIADVEELFTITASAGAGGSVDPSGEVKVESGDSQLFIITPDDEYRISLILADGREVDGSDELTSKQTMYYSDTESPNAGNTESESSTKYYIFENVTDCHTLEVYFEAINTSDDNTPNIPINGDTGDDNAPDSPDSGNTDYSNDSGDSGSNNTVSDSVPVDISDTTVTSNVDIINSNTATPASKDNEPKTGDFSHIETYATIAMIAGLSYLLLYFADGKNGMTEAEKKEIVSALIKWAKKGKRLRKYAALTIIFLVLVYYHGIGKHTTEDWKAAYEK